MTFIEQIKHVREKLFLSQEAFAKELGVSFATVNRWETGRCKPNYKAKKLFHEFCEAKGIKFEDNSR
jgi:DNA-binding transcriptional regulator YiaG